MVEKGRILPDVLPEGELQGEHLVARAFAGPRKSLVRLRRKLGQWVIEKKARRRAPDGALWMNKYERKSIWEKADPTPSRPSSFHRPIRKKKFGRAKLRPWAFSSPAAMVRTACASHLVSISRRAKAFFRRAR